MKFTAHFAANVRAYCTVEIEAPDEDAAAAEAEKIVASLKDDWSHPALEDKAFRPHYDTLDDFVFVGFSEEEPDAR